MINFNKKIQEQFDKMSKSGKLFRVDLSGDSISEAYLASFSEENDPVFRDPASTSHNCNHCKNFLRRYGNIVAVTEDFKIATIFDIDIEGEYAETAKALSKKIGAAKIKEVFFETFDELNSLPYEKCTKNAPTFRLGLESNPKRYTKAEAELYGGNIVKEDELRLFNHIFLTIPKIFVDHSGSSIGTISEKHRSAKEVFQRAMEEIPLVTLELVRDLINQNSLLDGETHVYKVNQFIPMKEAYDNLSAKQRDNWCWEMSRDLPFAKFKNELIGTLCSELAQGVELNKACKAWNYRVDPVNYMKAVAPFTEKQKQIAAQFVKDNNYTDSFNRRLAIIDDIKTDEIKHINGGDGSIPEISMFDNLKTTKAHQHKKSQFDNIDEVSIEKFMKDILPGCTGVEAYLDNSHEGNMVTMTTSNVDESKPMFKWDNNYSWSFNGNLAGKSQIKEAVKSKGGRVDGDLRFSIMWAEKDGDNSDLDAHCKEPGGFEISFQSTRSYTTGGNLDVDIQTPQSEMPSGAVENITYPSKAKMENGVYKMFVHQYSNRASKGFKAEIEFDGETFSYEYNKALSHKSSVQVAEVTMNNGVMSIVHKLPETNASKEIYGLETKNFHKVNLVCLSPNHWGENKVGNKHFFFMLEACKAVTDIRSYHIENFNSELAEHRKVLEPLATTIMISPEGKQLSGLGFNATVPDELIVKLSGTHKRTVKIKF